MIIDKIKIQKFRGFQDVEIQMGKNLTIIAGQNGTQKTTVLGMISQPFSITSEGNPLRAEKPMSGGNYRSAFGEKFKLSDAFDLPQTHEWTLNLSDGTDFTLESMRRSNTEGIRFWKKGDRRRGSGYIAKPVVYLSLSRLFPIAEDERIGTSTEISLSPDEQRFIREWHNKILIIPDLELTQVDYVSGSQKRTIGANTRLYDWKMNSAGQDNLGKILLAILSFKRLKERYPNDYDGGILAIDEIDATLYPASQIKLLEALRKFSSQYSIQIVFTTHSLTILKSACELQDNPRIGGQVSVVYLQKRDSNVVVVNSPTFATIEDYLNVAISPSPTRRKIPTYTEDEECKIFAKALLGRRASHLHFIDVTLGCENYIDLIKKGVPSFQFPKSLVIFDGDVLPRKVAGMRNTLILPGNISPERVLARYLFGLPDSSRRWSEIGTQYSKQFAFRDFSLDEIINNRIKAKEWFRQQKPYWGRGCKKVIDCWSSDNPTILTSFLSQYDAIVAQYPNS